LLLNNERFFEINSVACGARWSETRRGHQGTERSFKFESTTLAGANNVQKKFSLMVKI
jgi:hypothetical protein